MYSSSKEVAEKMLDKLPIELRPQTHNSSRCCIYHDRAVIKYRLMSLLGFSCDDETDETRTLTSYCQEAFQRDLKKRDPEKPPLSVCKAACSSCPPARVVVTGNCRGCFARPCMYSCPKGAISIVNQVSTIDSSKCIKCGRCIVVCPTKSRKFQGMTYTMASMKFNLAYKERREPEMFFARYN